MREARRIELDFFNKKGVWMKVPYEEARRRTGKPPIIVRWVDTNKGMKSRRITGPAWWPGN